jgi:hypothetical protein
MKTRILRTGLFFLLSSLSVACLAQMYMCVDATGAKTFSDKSCGNNAKVHALTPSAGSFDSKSTTLEDTGYRPLPNPPGYSVQNNSTTQYVGVREVRYVAVERRHPEPIRHESHHVEK